MRGRGATRRRCSTWRRRSRSRPASSIRARTSTSTSAARSTCSRRCARAREPVAGDLRLDQQGLRRPRRHPARRLRRRATCRRRRACARRGIDESRPLDFHTPYGCSKGAADQYVLDYARSFGLPTGVFRMSCIYGPRQMGTEDQGWVAHFLIRALEGEPITHLRRRPAGARHPRRRRRGRTPTSRPATTSTASPGRAFNLGGGPANAISLLPADRRYRATSTGREVPLEFEDWRPGDQRWYVADTQRGASGARPAAPARLARGRRAPRRMAGRASAASSSQPAQLASAAE